MGMKLALLDSTGTRFELADYLDLDEGWTAAALGDGMDLAGEADIETVELASKLTAGAAVAVSRVGNAEKAIPLVFEGPSSGTLTDAEAALVPFVDDAQALVYTPPDGIAPDTVWDVQYASLKHEWDDQEEAQTRRHWTLAPVCRPWARTADPTSMPVLDPPPSGATSTQTVTTCDTAAGAFATVDYSITSSATQSGGPHYVVTPTVVGGGVRASKAVQQPGGSSYKVKYNLTIGSSGLPNPPAATTMPWLKIIYGYSAVRPGSASVSFPDWYPAVRTNNGDGTYTAWFPWSDTVTPSQVRIMLTTTIRSGDKGTEWIEIYDVTLTNASPYGNDQRMQDRHLLVAGTKPAEAAFTLTAQTDAGVADHLGSQVMVYTSTHPDSLAPPLHQWRTAGPTRTGNTALLSGSYNNLATSKSAADTYTIPLDSVEPGTYQILIKAATGTTAQTATIRWSVITVNPVDGTHFGDQGLTGSVTIIIPAGYGTTAPYLGGEVILAIGTAALPTMQFAELASSVNLELRIWADDGPTVRFDLPFLVNLDVGQLSLVDTSGLGTVSSVEYVAPGFEGALAPQCFIGMSAGTFDAAARVAPLAVHRFEPGENRAFFVMVRPTQFGSTSHPAIEGTYYPRFHSFVQAPA